MSEHSTLVMRNASNSFSCSKCNLVYSMEEIFQMTAKCQHQFCRSCATNFLTTWRVLRCPSYPKCEEKMSTDDAMLLVDERELLDFSIDSSSEEFEDAFDNVPSAPPLEQNSDVFFCGVCTNVCAVDFVFNVSEQCRHQICRICAEVAFLNASQNNRQSSATVFHCPIAGCQAVVDSDSIKMLIDFDDEESPPKETFDCNLCLQSHAVDDLFKGSDCEHKICRDCARNYFQSLTANHKSLKCPEVGCEGAYSLEDAGLVVDATEYESLSQMLLKMALSTFTKCPKPDCPGVAEVVPPNRRFTCPICFYDMCSECNKDWHATVTCAQYAQWAVENGRADAEYDRYIKNKKIQVCPTCRAAVEKAMGCNHMTCRCGCHFCYLCGQKLSQTAWSDHFKAKCVLFRYPELE